jgi:glycosyltransferase involved in cell wall biosynthesis
MTPRAQARPERSGRVGGRPRILAVTTWYPTAEHPSSGAFVEDDVRTLATFADVRVLHLDPHGTETRSRPAGDDPPVLTMPLRWRDPLSVGRAVRTIRHHARGADLVHTMAFPALLLTRAGGPLRSPWLHTEHFSTLVEEDPSWTARAVQALARPAFAGPDTIVAVSRMLAARIEQLSGRDDVEVIGNHVAEAVTLAERRREGPLRVVATGGLIDRKNPLLMVDTLAEYQRTAPAELVWYGDGPLREKVLQRARDRGVQVRLPGAVPRADLLQRLAEADVYAVPTRRETFFLGAAEAAAHGLPVLTTDTGPHTDFLDPEYATMLPVDASPERWAEGLRELMARTRDVPAARIAQTMLPFTRPALAGSYRRLVDRALRGRRPGKVEQSAATGECGTDLLVFHAPYEIAQDGARGSAIRPRRMLDALAELGPEVLQITGDSRRRVAGLRELKRRLGAGHRVRAAYFENASIPTLIADPDHLPHRPDVDLRILRLLKRHRVPVGYFYRDVYWRFERYVETVGRPMAEAMRLLYRAELLVLRWGVDVMFLPSLRMGEHIPHIPAERFAALPPGAGNSPLPLPGEPFTVLYVGGIGEYYRIHALLEAARDTEGVRVILCTREEEWQNYRADYEELLTDRVEVVHASGAGLEELYTRAHVCSLVMAPDSYRDFAAPVKLYEYIGFGRPIISTVETHAADVVEAFGCGITVRYDAAEIGRVLRRLRDDRDTLDGLAERSRAAARENTWAARVRQMLEALDRQTAEETA